MQEPIDNTIADGIIGSILTFLTGYSIQIAHFFGLINIAAVDAKITLAMHCLGLIIASVTVTDIIYKKLKARKHGKTNIDK